MNNKDIRAAYGVLLLGVLLFIAFACSFASIGFYILTR